MRELRKNNEFQVFGIPGAGKTTYLTQSIQNAANKVGGENLIVSSFTRAAAEELVGRDLPIPPQNIGTLHSLCYRSLGSPPLAEKKIQEFSERFPRFAISKSKSVDMDEGEADQSIASEMDKTFLKYQNCRASLEPREKWTSRVQNIASAWETWKQENGYIDFTDMIEMALHDLPYPPNNATIGIFDEAQDFSPLQLKLIRTWAKQLDYIMIAGDDDQAIFGFIAADPRALLDAQIPPERKTILDRSYRVPRVIQRLAQTWIEKIRAREPKDQKPRINETGEEVEGKISRTDAHFRNEERTVDLIERHLQELDSGQDMMVLSSCSYMLGSVLQELRRRGIPFSNKYKRKNRAWNPLTPGKGASTVSRMMDYLEPAGPIFAKRRLWKADQLASWIELCNTKGVLVHGAKKKIQEAADSDLSYQELFNLITACFVPEKLNEAVKLDLDWLKRNVTAKKATALEYPAAVLTKFGRQALENRTQLTIGTIHSVKGGQADKVLLFPDLSMQAAQFAETRTGKESVIRQFYVGITRAKEELIIASPAGKMFIPI